MASKAFTVLVLLGACTTAEPEEPPFTYRLWQPNGGTTGPSIVLELEFESFTAAQQAGPQTVMVTDEDVSAEVTMEIGYCTHVAPCAGALALEELHLSLKPFRPDHVSGYECVGLAGSLTVGVDGFGTGNCE